MLKQKHLTSLAWNLKRLALYEMIIVAAVGLLCAAAGWHSVNEIATALLVVGVFIFSIGPFCMLGGWGNTRNFSYLYGQTMQDRSGHERLAQDRADINKSTSLVVPSVVFGTLTMVLATVFQVVFS